MSAHDVVENYEVFTNDGGALAFFLGRNKNLDALEDAGPFSFSFQENDRIAVGTKERHTIFSKLSQTVVDRARRRGVILLVEFEDQKPVRCTPCYLRS